MATSMPTSRKFLVTVSEAADLLSVSRTTIYKLHRRGEVEIIKIANAARIRLVDIERLAGIGVAS